MPKIRYISKDFRAATLQQIHLCNDIIAEYQELEMTLTLRQLYYQLVARGFIPNKQLEYSKLSRVMSDARLAGLVDWHSLEDRTRFMRATPHWATPDELVKTAANQFRIDKWEKQDFHVEVFIEKDALVGVIEAVCRNLDITYASCRGYMSQSMMWEAGQRIRYYAASGKQILIVHLGDHDPSGIHMSSDIEGRLRLFMGSYAGKLAFKRIALNFDQVEEHNPPPNPAKMTDPRSKEYVALHGDESWELDALDPKVIAGLIEESVLEVRDETAWGIAVEEEDQHRKSLRVISKHFSDIESFIEDEGFADE